MIRISITPFDAIKATLPVGSVAYEPQRTAQGGYFIWIERSWLNKLEALRQLGEDLSGTIIRLVALEAGGRPGRRAAELFGAEPRRREFERAQAVNQIARPRRTGYRRRYQHIPPLQWLAT